MVKWGGARCSLAFVAFRLPPSASWTRATSSRRPPWSLFAIVGVSIIMLTGWAGQVSLGQMAVVGVGAVDRRAGHQRVGPRPRRSPSSSAALAGAVVAVIVGLPALRVRGLFLAVTTLAFAITASNYLLNPKYFAWIPQGPLERPPLFGKLDLEPPRQHVLPVPRRARS